MLCHVVMTWMPEDAQPLIKCWKLLFRKNKKRLATTTTAPTAITTTREHPRVSLVLCQSLKLDADFCSYPVLPLV